MSVRVCLDCSVAYGALLEACPRCSARSRGAVYEWDSDVAREFGRAFWVAENATAPEDLPRRVTLTGPGAAIAVPRPRGRPRKAEAAA